MKDILAKLNPAFDNRHRLGIMAILAVNDWVEYVTLKEALQLTDGNLASHIKALEKEAYVRVRKEFVGRKPRTTYEATQAGRAAFQLQLDTLETLIQIAREDD
jgi:DNA-binding PadR family transcriptional regulator